MSATESHQTAGAAARWNGSLRAAPAASYSRRPLALLVQAQGLGHLAEAMEGCGLPAKFSRMTRDLCEVRGCANGFVQGQGWLCA